MRLGEILIDKGLITSEQLQEALAQQRKTGEFIGTILIKKKFIKEKELFEVLSEQLHIDYVNLKDITIERSVIEKVPAKFSWHYKIIPVRFSGNKLTVATSDPLRSLNDLRLFLNYEIEPVLASESEILEAARKYYGVGAETVESIMSKAPKEPKRQQPAEKIEDIEKTAEDASVIKLVNQILLEAYQKRATDIHIEPYRDRMGLRYRIDGVLYEANIPPGMKQFFPAIISRIKIMSRLNIVERRLPQDGRALVKIGKEKLDLRISIIPTRHGEGVVIRILPTNMLFSLEKLGLEPEDLKTIDSFIKKPHGIIFVTGPTGSGKSTTLYTCLSTIKSTANKIITLEDPVEYELEGISQIQIMPEIGFSFATGLRSILRHDPDVLMVGEVRDLETAELAIRVALTGHLIFSTVHTNDAAGGVTRLLNIGIEPFLLSSSVEAFIAQRLIRVICPKCKKEDKEAEGLKKQMIEDIAEFAKINKRKDIQELSCLKQQDIRIYKGQGCEACHSTGFQGRTAIYEILVVNRPIKELILAKASADAIREEAIKQGMRTLRMAGWKKVIEGVSTPSEVLRVTQAEE